MGSRYEHLKPDDIEFIGRQHMFSVATAAADGSINLSPKGLDTFRVLSQDRVVWLNLTGSGNETSAHLQADGRITLMFCSFDEQPLILRLYGSGRVVHPYDAEWPALSGHFAASVGARQVIDCRITAVQRSCGFGVPFMEYRGERPNMQAWIAKQGEAGIRAYWAEKNRYSVDGKPTHILKDTY